MKNYLTENSTRTLQHFSIFHGLKFLSPWVINIRKCDVIKRPKNRITYFFRASETQCFFPALKSNDSIENVFPKCDLRPNLHLKRQLKRKGTLYDVKGTEFDKTE